MALNLTVKVHPVVLFQIVDAYERRKAESHRVIGTLLGSSSFKQIQNPWKRHEIIELWDLTFQLCRRRFLFSFYKLICTGTAEKGMVEVTNCFCVPHKESESQVEADLTYGIDLYELNHRVNAQENIVGWWATGNEVIYIKNYMKSCT